MQAGLNKVSCAAPRYYRADLELRGKPQDLYKYLSNKQLQISPKGLQGMVQELGRWGYPFTR
jgi:hypothetical protein